VLRAVSRRTVAGRRAAVIVQEMRGRECLLVLHTHDEEGPANAVIIASLLCWEAGSDVWVVMQWEGSGCGGRRAVSGVVLLLWWRQQSHTKAQDVLTTIVSVHTANHVTRHHCQPR
jgi:hypothetical protein